jgi:hypothetical protein
VKTLSITDCPGYLKLLAAIERDKPNAGHDYQAKFDWVIERAQHYAEKTGLAAADILDSWEASRNYWYMNYYQEANQPTIKGDNVRVFETADELLVSIGKAGFRCPACSRVSTSPYVCSHKDVCDWKVYGLFGHMGKGVFVYVKDQLRGENLFMPIAWEVATCSGS